MVLYRKESLETLRDRIDLVEVLSAHLDLKRAGASYKGLCPFHDEKTPSFMIQKGDRHYHCFGCGAHGDAIQFLMTHLSMSFIDAVENLAQRFHVHLDRVEGAYEHKGPDKKLLRAALGAACRFYQFHLLHTPEGHEAMKYLHGRGLDNAFMQQFRIGWAPKTSGLFREVMREMGIAENILIAAGLLARTERGTVREFFGDRIQFPIHDASGSVIGFSGRKYKVDTFGGKYVNTPETPLFKKSRTLFGLHHCRRRIAKERRAIVVEGQIDALRLIQKGFNISVAGQGTAFGEGHVKELINLGVTTVSLALDPDEAGWEATRKIGDLFQREGVAVKVVQMPEGLDPDSYLQQYGAEGFTKLLEKSVDYLPFLVQYLSRSIDIAQPAGKNELVQMIAQQIRQWNHSLVVHESLRQLAHLTQVPEQVVGVGQEHVPNIHIRRQASVGLQKIDPDRILESDLLRWLLLIGEGNTRFRELARENLSLDDFRVGVCRKIYQTYFKEEAVEQPRDFLSLAIDLDDEEGQLVMGELMNKKVNRDRAEEQYRETIQKILDRNWMEEREKIKMRIQSGQCSDDEVMALVKEFDRVKRDSPKVKDV